MNHSDYWKEYQLYGANDIINDVGLTSFSFSFFVSIVTGGADLSGLGLLVAWDVITVVDFVCARRANVFPAMQIKGKRKDDMLITESQSSQSSLLLSSP